MMEFVPLLLLVVGTLAGSNTDPRTSIIKQIIDQAIYTFTTPHDKFLFQVNLNDLSRGLNRLIWSDVSARYDSREGKDLPISYAQVYKDSNVTIGMFTLKPNSRLPLHNHPLMHGIMRVLRGSVHVQSYSHYPNDRIKEKSKFEVCLPSERYFLEEMCGPLLCDGAVTDKDTFVVRKNTPIILDDTSGCSVLTPVMNNFHEIRAYNGEATFFDILAPPHRSFVAEMGPGECTYIEEDLGVISTPKSGNAEHECKDVTLKLLPEELIYYV